MGSFFSKQDNDDTDDVDADNSANNETDNSANNETDIVKRKIYDSVIQNDTETFKRLITFFIQDQEYINWLFYNALLNDSIDILIAYDELSLLYLVSLNHQLLQYIELFPSCEILRWFIEKDIREDVKEKLKKQIQNTITRNTPQKKLDLSPVVIQTQYQYSQSEDDDDLISYSELNW